MSVNHHDAASAGLDPHARSPEVPPGSAGRDGPEWRQLSFRASGLVIELEITGSGDCRRLTGQLIPRQSALVDVRHGQGMITVKADPLGRFSAEQVPFGQVSLRCRLGSDQSPVATGWISLLTGPSGRRPMKRAHVAVLVRRVSYSLGVCRQARGDLAGLSRCSSTSSSR